jgi:hypothetical protein
MMCELELTKKSTKNNLKLELTLQFQILDYNPKT